MEKSNTYIVYVYLKDKEFKHNDFEELFEDIEAISEEEAIKMARESFSYREEEDDEGGEEFDLSNYKFIAINKP